MNDFFTAFSQSITGANHTDRDIKALQKSLEGTLQPLIASLNKATIAGAGGHKFHLTVTRNRNPWDQQPHVAVSIGHFTPGEYKAALFFNKHPRKTRTPEGIDFREINDREYKFSAYPLPQTSKTNTPRSLYHFTDWQKGSDPDMLRQSGLRVRQSKTMHIAAKPQADFTQNFDAVIRSALTYFEFKLGHLVAPSGNTPPAVRPLSRAARRHEAAVAQI